MGGELGFQLWRLYHDLACLVDGCLRCWRVIFGSKWHLSVMESEQVQPEGKIVALGNFVVEIGALPPNSRGGWWS